MNRIILLEPFSKWLKKLKDPIAKARIISRLDRLKMAILEIANLS